MHLQTGARLRAFVALALGFAAGASRGAAAPNPNAYPVETAFGGVVFNEPVQVVFAPNETNRAFVVERAGRITMVPDLAHPARVVLLDLSPSVNQFDSGHGMLSMAFHPNFAQNGFFYVWTSFWSGGSRSIELLRYTLGSNSRVDPASQVVILSQPVGSGGHDGGTVLFGPDGYLYLSIGDGDEGEPGPEAVASHQRIDRGFFGAVLRIDVDKRPGNLTPNPHLGQTFTGYLVPADNPYVGATSFNGQPVVPSQVRTEFWATGLRNPFRMAFDGATGDLWAGDVGLSTMEEIDLLKPGRNYGWNFYEGTVPGPAYASTPGGVPFALPVWAVDHSQGDVCIIGGTVYRGPLFAELQGKYLFGDLGSGHIWALSNPGSPPAQAGQVAQIASSAGIVSLTVHPGTGDILWANISSGLIQRLGARTAAAAAPIATSQPSSATVATGASAAFNFSAAGTPSPAYQWYLNGVPIAGATDPTLLLSGVSGPSGGQYTCVASNSAGSVGSAPAMLFVVSAPASPRLANLSSRARVGSGSDVLIAGFVITGTTAKTVLLRGAGPALAPFGVAGTLPDPLLQVFTADSTLVATNRGWAASPEVASAARSVGAFGWGDSASADCALLLTLAPGAYSAEVSGASGDSGVALVEVYELP